MINKKVFIYGYIFLSLFSQCGTLLGNVMNDMTLFGNELFNSDLVESNNMLHKTHVQHSSQTKTCINGKCEMVSHSNGHGQAPDKTFWNPFNTQDFPNTDYSNNYQEEYQNNQKPIKAVNKGDWKKNDLHGRNAVNETTTKPVKKTVTNKLETKRMEAKKVILQKKAKKQKWKKTVKEIVVKFSEKDVRDYDINNGNIVMYSLNVFMSFVPLISRHYCATYQ